MEKEMQKSKERKREKIVLNAAIKVKPKENTSCNIYSSGHEVLGKKEEFRWLINAWWLIKGLTLKVWWLVFNVCKKLI